MKKKKVEENRRTTEDKKSRQEDQSPYFNPVVSTIDELVGKSVKHFTYDYGSTEKWFNEIVVLLEGRY